MTDLVCPPLNSTGLREHARPYLEELRQRCRYTVSLAVLDGPEILYIDRARSFRRGQNKIDLTCAQVRACPRTALRGKGIARQPTGGREADLIMM